MGQRVELSGFPFLTDKPERERRMDRMKAVLKVFLAVRYNNYTRFDDTRQSTVTFDLKSFI